MLRNWKKQMDQKTGRLVDFSIKTQKEVDDEDRGVWGYQGLSYSLDVWTDKDLTVLNTARYVDGIDLVIRVGRNHYEVTIDRRYDSEIVIENLEKYLKGE